MLLLFLRHIFVKNLAQNLSCLKLFSSFPINFKIFLIDFFLCPKFKWEKMLIKSHIEKGVQPRTVEISLSSYHGFNGTCWLIKKYIRMLKLFRKRETVIKMNNHFDLYPPTQKELLKKKNKKFPHRWKVQKAN